MTCSKLIKTPGVARMAAFPEKYLELQIIASIQVAGG